MYDQDVFVNVVGGVRVLEPAADLAVLCAAVSSLRNRPLGRDLVVFGEIGLAGEVRPVQRGQERIREAAKLGFKRAVLPAANMPKKGEKGEAKLGRCQYGVYRKFSKDSDRQDWLIRFSCSQARVDLADLHAVLRRIQVSLGILRPLHLRGKFGLGRIHSHDRCLNFIALRAVSSRSCRSVLSGSFKSSASVRRAS